MSGEGMTSFTARLRVAMIFLGVAAVPARHLVVFKAILDHGGDIREIGGSHRSGRGERHQFFVRQQPMNRSIKFKRDIDVAAEHGAGHVWRGAERHDGNFNPGRAGEQLGRKILRTAGIDGADVQFARVGARRCSSEPARVTSSRSKNEAVETEVKSVSTLYGSDVNSAAAIALLFPVINNV